MSSPLDPQPAAPDHDDDDVASRHRRIAIPEPPPSADDEDDDVPVAASVAPRRARRRPRAEHVSQVPRAVDAAPESTTSPEKPAARKGKKGAGKAQRPVERTRHLPFEIAGVVLAACAVLVALSLASYSAADMQPSTSGGHPVANWIGPAGAFVADLITLVFGVPGFAMPLVIGLLAVVCIRPIQRVGHAALRLTATTVATASWMALLHLALRNTHLLPFPAGGLIGAFLADSGSRVLAPLGTGVVACTLAFLGVLVALDRPVGATARSVARFFVDGWRRATESIDVWREERRLLVEEEERLRRELEEEEAEAEDDDALIAAVALAEEERRRDEEARKLEERRARISDKANKGAREKLQQRLAAEAATSPPKTSASALPTRAPVVVTPIALAPAPLASVVAAPTAVDGGGATILQSDPPWARELDEPKVIPLSQALARKKAALDVKKPAAADKPTPPVAPVAPVAAPERAPAADAAAQIVLDDDDGEFKIVERKIVDAATIVREAEKEEQVVVVEKTREFQLPALHLLDYDAPQPEPIDEAKMRAQADKLVAKFKDFGIEGRVREVRPGPVVTTYEFVPAPGIKVSKIAALSDDIAMAMEAVHVRIVAPIPGKGAVGIEIPNDKRETVYMKEIIADPAFRKREDKLLMALGKDIEGKSYYANLAEMPHVLIAGTTGSGKSVSVNAMICSILYRATPDDVRFLMIDPKMLELSLYDGIPHLLLPPIIDTKKAAVALKWAVAEMERRYQLMSDLGVRDLKGFNERALAAQAGNDDEAKKKLVDKAGKPVGKLPFIVVIIDEYADLLATAGKDVEAYVMRLAQKARAAGIHVMLATQRPSVDVITGVIKANFPVRMGFRLASSHDSKTIINQPGAEKLLGRGDMLFMPPGTSNVGRVHGAFISEKELHRVVDFLKQQGTPSYDMSILAHSDDDEEGGEGGDVVDEKKDDRYEEAVALVARTKKCSTSYLQRVMNLGYQRAARIVDMMEREKLVGPALNAKGDREIYVKPDGGDE